MRVCISLGVLGLVIFTVASFIMPISATTTWTIQTISANALSLSSIALDSNNYPHIAYTNYSNDTDYLTYSSWNGSAWVNQIVAPNAASYGIVLDSHNNAHMLFKKMGGVEELMYVYWTGYDWSTQTVDSQGLEGSIALDSIDRPHIAYFTIGNATSHFFLKYSSWSGSAWSSEIVDAGDMTYLPSLKLDAEDRPHIMYETNTVFTPQNSSQELKYATLDNTSGWTIQTVGQDIGFRDMILDASGQPHFTYKTTYASWTGSAWSTQSFSSKFNSSVYLGDSYLALDNSGYPYITLDISSENGSSLMYIRWTGTEWDIQTVDSNYVLAGTIAIDSNGNPHICYFRRSGSLGSMPLYDLMYATTIVSTQTLITSLIGLLIAILVTVVLIIIFVVHRWKKSSQLEVH